MRGERGRRGATIRGGERLLGGEERFIRRMKLLRGAGDLLGG